MLLFAHYLAHKGKHRSADLLYCRPPFRCPLFYSPILQTLPKCAMLNITFEILFTKGRLIW